MKLLIVTLVGASLGALGAMHQNQPVEPETPRQVTEVEVRQIEEDAARLNVSGLLDDFHDAASHADYERYTGHFAADFVFLGTDATERWDHEAFAAFCADNFGRGRGWTYHPRDRFISLAAGGRVAWFDEMLDHDKYGVCRGSGVCVLDEGEWKVAQYNLSIPMPNELAEGFVEKIRASGLPGTTPRAPGPGR